MSVDHNEIELQANDPQYVYLYGASGVGKSTLLSAL